MVPYILYSQEVPPPQPPKYKEEFLCCVGDHALKQIAQIGYRFSLTGDIQDPYRHNPGPRALG